MRHGPPPPARTHHTHLNPRSVPPVPSGWVDTACRARWRPATDVWASVERSNAPRSGSEPPSESALWDQLLEGCRKPEDLLDHDGTLYARGMTVREMQGFLLEQYGVEVSGDRRLRFPRFSGQAGVGATKRKHSWNRVRKQSMTEPIERRRGSSTSGHSDLRCFQTFSLGLELNASRHTVRT
jgi:hypothetical protein